MGQFMWTRRFTCGPTSSLASRRHSIQALNALLRHLTVSAALHLAHRRVDETDLARIRSREGWSNSQPFGDLSPAGCVCVGCLWMSWGVLGKGCTKKPREKRTRGSRDSYLSIFGGFSAYGRPSGGRRVGVVFTAPWGVSHPFLKHFTAPLETFHRLFTCYRHGRQRHRLLRALEATSAVKLNAVVTPLNMPRSATLLLWKLDHRPS